MKHCRSAHFPAAPAPSSSLLCVIFCVLCIVYLIRCKHFNFPLFWPSLLNSFVFHLRWKMIETITHTHIYVNILLENGTILWLFLSSYIFVVAVMLFKFTEKCFWKIYEKFKKIICFIISYLSPPSAIIKYVCYMCYTCCEQIISNGNQEKWLSSIFCPLCAHERERERNR